MVDTKPIDTLEPVAYGDASKGGINDAFDRFDAMQAEAEAKNVPSTPIPVAPVKEIPAASAIKEAPVTPVAPVKDDLEIPEEDFFPTASTTLPEAGKGASTTFDEASFDKETEDSTKGMEPKAGEKFKALRAELKVSKQATITPDVQQKLTDLETKANEAEGLRKQLEVMSGQSAKLQVENSAEYARDVIAPADALFARCDALALANKVDPSVLRNILLQPDLEKRNALIEEHAHGFSSYHASELYLSLREFDNLIGKRESMMANAQEKVNKLEAERVETNNRIITEQRNAVQTHQKDFWSKHKALIPGLVDKDGKETPAYTELMQRSLAIDFGTSRAKDQAYAACTGIAFNHVLKEVGRLRKQLAEYEKGDARELGGRPGVVPVAGEKDPTGKAKGFVERMADVDFA
jgi:hypothetical protein